MTDNLTMRSLLRNVNVIARSLLPEKAQTVLVKMNKLLLSAVEEKVDTVVFDELRAALASMEVDDADEDLNVLFYFHAQSLLISFTHRKSSMDRLDNSNMPQQREDEFEMEEDKPVVVVQQEASVTRDDDEEQILEHPQTPKCEPLDASEFETSMMMESSEKGDADAPIDEAFSVKSDTQESADDDEPMSEEDEEDAAKDSTTVKCPFCSTKFAARSYASIRQHIFQRHEFTGSLFKCLKCNIGVNSESHLKGCTGPLVFDYNPAQKPRFGRRSIIVPGRTCPICKEQLKTSWKNGIALSSLSTHFQDKHKKTPGTFFRCTKCIDIRMRLRSSVNKHFEKAACGGEVEFFHCTEKP